MSVFCWVINEAHWVFWCGPAVFQVWRGIGAGTGVGGGWSQGWTRCLPWDSDGRKAQVRIFNYPVWLIRCRGGRARLGEVYQKGRGAIRLPTDMLSIRLPQLLDIHQVPKVRLMMKYTDDTASAEDPAVNPTLFRLKTSCYPALKKKKICANKQNR